MVRGVASSSRCSAARLRGGNRMTPTHVSKGGIKYRYYLSSSLLHGQPERAGSVHRVPATEVEALVASAVRGHLRDSTGSDDKDLIRDHVVRVEVQADQLAVELKAEASNDPSDAVDNDRPVLRVPWRKTSKKRRREIIVPASELGQRGENIGNCVVKYPAQHNGHAHRQERPNSAEQKERGQ